MTPLWAFIFGVVTALLFVVGLTFFAVLKVGKDSDRMWEKYFQKLEDEKEKKDDTISNV